jgi:dihydrolipoamide dehydrogenase
VKKEFDVVVIGGGPGGTPAAIELAAKGKKVMLVEKSGKLGGACLFVGCIPSKIIKHSADEYFYGKRNAPTGDSSRKRRDDYWRQIQKNMAHILSSRSGAARENIKKLDNMTFASGSARFLSNHEVEISEEGNDNYTVEFKHAIIATGASSSIPPFKGNAVNQVLTSETIFSKDSLPGSLVIIGGGPIGIELAQMFSKLDVKCTVIEVLDTILKGVVEPEFVEGITSRLRNSGVDIYTSSRVVEINNLNNEFSVTFLGPDGNKRTIKSEQVLVSAGKTPNLGGLNLDSTDIAYTPKGIAVNEYLETNVEGVYATGDVINAPKFAHTATYEAHIVAANILAKNSVRPNFSKNSWVLFSDPEIASAGYTEAEAINRGIDVVTGIYDYKIDAVTQINGDPFGFLKFVVDRKTSIIVGVHIFVKDAASIVGEAALIVSKGLTLLDVSQAIYPHPTLSEAYGFLASKMLSGAMRK